MTQAFISYSRKDVAFIEQLSADLKIADVDAWYDLSGLEGGSRWSREIEKAIRASEYVIVVLSPDSVASEWVEEEILYARKLKKKIIPLLYRLCEIPLGYYALNFIDVQGGKYRQNYKEILRALGINRSDREKAERTLREAEEFERQKKETKKKDHIPPAGVTTSSDAKNFDQINLNSNSIIKQGNFEKPKLVEKELREKQAREAREKEKHVSGKKEEKSVAVKPKSGGQIAYWFGGLILLVLGIVFLSSLNNPPPTPQPTPENTQTEAIVTLVQDTVEPGITTTPKLTSTPAVTLTPTPLPTEITDTKGVSMVFVPAGEFRMGSNEGSEDEKPVHTVFLDDFYIDKYEVTNLHYKECVDTGNCEIPVSRTFDDIAYINHPVVGVSWEQAENYCEWRGAYLPTEAEWEKAARGIDERNYPSGYSISCLSVNYYPCDHTKIGTTEVGSYESGMSPYGAYDMAGNVWEWVADWYQADYYSTLGDYVVNPKGPLTGQVHVKRGGSWNTEDVRTTERGNGNNIMNYWIDSYGFRCAKDATP